MSAAQRLAPALIAASAIIAGGAAGYSPAADPDEYERREQMSRQRGGFGGSWSRRRFKQNARKARS